MTPAQIRRQKVREASHHMMFDVVYEKGELRPGYQMTLVERERKLKCIQRCEVNGRTCFLLEITEPNSDGEIFTNKIMWFPDTHTTYLARDDGKLLPYTKKTWNPFFSTPIREVKIAEQTKLL